MSHWYVIFYQLIVAKWDLFQPLLEGTAQSLILTHSQPVKVTQIMIKSVSPIA